MREHLAGAFLLLQTAVKEKRCFIFRCQLSYQLLPSLYDGVWPHMLWLLVKLAAFSNDSSSQTLAESFGIKLSGSNLIGY